MKKSTKNLSFFIQRGPGYILWLLSFFFLRSKKKWCFGSQTGFGGSNSAYLMFDFISKHPEIKVAWITEDINSYETLNTNGIPVYKKWSLKGLWFCLTSKVYVYSHGVGDVNFATSGGTFKVNLWHGISYKNIEYLAQLKWVNKRNPIHRIVYPFYCVNHNLILSSSDYISKWLIDCFRTKESVMLYNFPPRCQTRNWSREQIIDYLSKFNPQLHPLIKISEKHRRTFLYMPTYRENTPCSVLEASHFDLFRMNDILVGNDDVMFVKFHPRDMEKLKEIPVLSNIIVIKDSIDPYLFFPYVSVLITDYSSVYPEFLLYNNQIIIFDFDKEKYELEENGCYYNIDDFVSAIHAHTFEDLVHIVEKKENFTIPQFDIMYKKFWGKCNGNIEIADQILSRISKRPTLGLA